MRPDAETVRSMLESADHGVLGTVHATRGTDLVPVVFGLHEQWLGIPIDTVKPKSSTTLQREENLDVDPRATLLVQHWDRSDWSRLWWVRATLRRKTSAPTEVEEALTAALVERYEQYVERPFVQLLVFHVEALSAWSASPR